MKRLGIAVAGWALRVARLALAIVAVWWIEHYSWSRSEVILTPNFLFQATSFALLLGVFIVAPITVVVGLTRAKGVTILGVPSADLAIVGTIVAFAIFWSFWPTDTGFSSGDSGGEIIVRGKITSHGFCCSKYSSCLALLRFMSC
jgi:hypothetical protein